MVQETYHAHEHLTVAVGLCSAGSLDRNLGNAPDSMGTFLLFRKKVQGQVKTSGKKAKAHGSFLSKSSRSPARDREERVGSFGATDISNTEKIGEPSGI